MTPRRIAPTGVKGKSTVLIACSLSDRRQRWEVRLQEQFTVCGVSERRALDEVLGYLRLGVLVLDLSLPGLGGLRGLRETHEASPSTRILALAARPTDTEGVAALEAGARGYYTRDIEPMHLKKAAEAVERGEIWIQRRLVNALLTTLTSIRASSPDDSATNDRMLGLTPRERQVGELITRGASNKEIAHQLNITERTVKAHLSEMFRDLQVTDRLQLALTLSAHVPSPLRGIDRNRGVDEPRLPLRRAVAAPTLRSGR
jgi:DNA-binding NarL/FixJ family response regulator